MKPFSPNIPNFARLSRLGREFFWITLGQAAVVAGGLIGLRLFTNYLSPETFGEIALVLTLVTLLNQILLGPLSGATLRFLAPAHEAHQIRAYLTAVRTMTIQVSLLIVGLTAVALLLLLLLNQPTWALLLLITILYALLTGYNQVLNGMQNAMRQRKVVAGHAAAGQWLLILFVLVAIIYGQPTTRYVMLGYLAAAACTLLSQFIFYQRKVGALIREEAASQPEPTPETAVTWRQTMRTYALPFAGWGIFTWAQMSSDRWALQLSSGASTVGYFAVLYRLGYYPISLLTSLIVQLLAPVLFQKAGDASDQARMKAIYRTNFWLVLTSLGLTAVAVLLTGWLHEWIFNLFVAPEYHTISWLLPWMVLAGGLFATGQIATIGLLSESESKLLLAPKISTAVLGAILNFATAYAYGLAGVVWASVFTAGLYLLWILHLVQRKVYATLPKIIS